MDALLSVNWIALLVLIIALLLFKVLNKLAYKINWTFVILISMVRERCLESYLRPRTILI